MRVSSDHWTLLLEFADMHPGIITNKFFGKNARETMNQVWSMLTEQLNSLGQGSKSTEGWKKTLSDWKSKTKAKASKLRNSSKKTGGGSPSILILSKNEKKLLDFIETFAIEEDANLEYGFGEVREKLVSQSVVIKLEDHESMASSSLTDTDYFTPITNQDDASTSFNMDNSHVSQPMPHMKRKAQEPPCSISLDVEEDAVKKQKHDNTNTSSRRRRESQNLSDTILELNNETLTLTVLHSINSNLENLTSQIKKQTDSLEKIANAIVVIAERGNLNI